MIKGAPSVNPNGKPKGHRKAITQLQERLIETFAKEMEPEFKNIVNAMVKKAIKGDVQAAKLILERALPARKAVEHYGKDQGAGGVTIVVKGMDNIVEEGAKDEAVEGEFEEINEGDNDERPTM